MAAESSNRRGFLILNQDSFFLVMSSISSDTSMQTQKQTMKRPLPGESEKKSSAKRRRKAGDNSVVNSLTKDEIKSLAKKVFTTKYQRGRQGRNSRDTAKLSYPVPYLLRSRDGIGLFVNPFAFAWTKPVNWIVGRQLPPPAGAGYPTIRLKREGSSDIPRIPIHGVLYRYFNDYKQIKNQVSHLRDDPLCVTPDELLDEEGLYQRCRAGCMKYEWYKQGKCPHEPVCVGPYPVGDYPDWEQFTDEHREVLGEKGLCCLCLFEVACAGFTNIIRRIHLGIKRRRTENRSPSANEKELEKK